MTTGPISTSSEWTFELLGQYDEQIGNLAEEFGLDTYPNQIEIIRSEQMMDAYASVGMPVGYHHWSYGKRFLQTEQNYNRGQMGLAYEIVINSNPCISYLMEENTMTMQALVIAHACYGHNSFFKGNYLFRSWTDADSIIDYLLFARTYLTECEERYGVDQVEDLLDSCHALSNFGTDRYKRPDPVSPTEERERQKSREERVQKMVNDLWRTLPARNQDVQKQAITQFPSEPQENILYFIEKNAPVLEPWQREVIRIVRKLAQYFYPQRQTQVMNEGWATFWHYTLLNALYDKQLVTDGFMIEFLQSHTNVVGQPEFDSPRFTGINPYALGFAMMRDIKRICEEPTAEDQRWFPEIAGGPWLEALQFAMKNFKDESFILQYLSPQVIRDLKLFCIVDDDAKKEILVTAIHDDAGYRLIREQLARQYNLSEQEPSVEVHNADINGDRSITLHHQQTDRKPLHAQTPEIIKHLKVLWGFDVNLISFDQGVEVESWQSA